MFRRLALIVACCLCASAASAQQRDNVTLDAYADRDAIVAGEKLTIAVEQTIREGWHTYWLNPGDSGDAMRLTWTMPDGFSAGDIQWPAPMRQPYPPLMNYGYHDRATMLVDITAPASLPEGNVTLSAKAAVLVCADICIPEDHEISVTLPVAAASAPANENTIRAARAQMPAKADWPVVFSLDGDNVTITATTPDDLSQSQWFPLDWGLVDNPAPQTVNQDGDTVTITQKYGSRPLKELATTGFVVRNGDAFYAVSAKAEEGAARPATTTATTTTAASAPTPQPADNAADRAIPAETPATGLMQALMLAFFGGLILNLMPCVFPVLSMKALALASLPQKERNHAASSGAAYTAGVVISFVAVAAVMLGLKAAGAQIGWGFQLQNPVVVALLSWLIFLVGLNLAGLFEIRVSVGGKLAAVTQGKGPVATFFTGVLATIVATPCTAPFMATALGYALTQGNLVALLIFAVLGLGLAVPYLLVTLMPGLIRLLPKPGAWMVTFRQALSFPMFATGLWLLWVLGQQAGMDGIVYALGGGLGMVFVIWLMRHFFGSALKRVIIAVLIAATVIMMAMGLLRIADAAVPEAAQNANTADGIKWEKYDEAALDAALASNQPVLVNMTAAWCITCLMNERVALDTPNTRNLLSELHVRSFKGDWTNRDPAITAYLAKHGRNGVPLYVVYPAPPEGTNERPEHKVLPQILTPGIVADALGKE